MNRIIVGDCLETMRSLLAEGVKVQMCVTSPPYWGLRDYGCEGQLGLEPTPEDYVANMVEVFGLVRDLLVDDGTLWLNLGDSYAGGGNYRGINSENTLTTKQASNRGATGLSQQLGALGKETGLEPKNLIGIPWRVAFALQANGWWLRQDIIWSKPNPMPESVRDRCTKAHEYLFLLAKSERYLCDMEAIAEPSVTGDERKPYAPGQVDYRGNGHDRGGETIRTAGKHSEMPKNSSGHRIVENVARARAEGADHDNPFGSTRNKRSVWTIPTAPYPEAHFATFPPALIEPCILAGSRPGDIVFDPFMGSGTTGEVAQRFGRQWLGCELNPDYAKLAETRTSGTVGMQFA